MLPEPNKPSLWVPNTDVLVNAAGELIIKVELAAVAKDGIEMRVEGQRATFAGQRINPDRDGARHLVLEINHGRFESVLEVPEEFDLSRAQSTFENGMLRVVAPRRISGAREN